MEMNMVRAVDNFTNNTMIFSSCGRYSITLDRDIRFCNPIFNTFIPSEASLPGIILELTNKRELDHAS